MGFKVMNIEHMANILHTFFPKVFRQQSLHFDTTITKNWVK